MNAASDPRHLQLDCSPEEWQMRVDLAACYRLVALYGWSDQFGTHISARVPGTEHFLLNPYGVLFDQITASSLIKIDCDGVRVGAVEGKMSRAGFVIHSAIHMARPDAAFVMHTHTVAGVGVATQRDGLLPITQQALVVLPQVRYHDYEGVATSLEERESLKRDLGDRHILILRNHGLLTLGRSAYEAFMFMYKIERACKMQLSFQSAGVPAYPIRDSVVALTQEQGTTTVDWRTSAGTQEWDALLRKLDGIDGSFRE